MHVFKIYAVVVLCLFLVLQYADILGPLLWQTAVLGVSLVVGWWASLSIKRLLNSRRKVSPERLAVIIAGCDSEHGFVTASQLRRSGYYVFAGTQDAGDEVAAELEKLKVDVIELQPSNDGSLNNAYQNVCERLFKEGKRLHALVCNVGTGQLGELEWISDRAMSRSLDETVVSTTRLVNRFLPLLRESRGRVVICAGPSGRVAIPGAGVHSIVNAALIAYAECLRREMYKFMVQVAIIEPVWINYRTPLSRMHSPGVAVKEVLRGLSRDVFEDYSLSYANAFRALWNRRTTRWYVGPPDTLASCTCSAVNDRVALPVYSCGYTEERVANEVLERLPSHFADIAQCFLYQPFAKLRLFTEADDVGREARHAHERIASPGLLQSLLHSTLSPKPVPMRASEMSSPARELQTLKGEHFASSDTADDVTPPPKTPPPVVQVKGEVFQPHRSEGHVNDIPSAPSTGGPSPLPGVAAVQARTFSPPPPSQQAVSQASGAEQHSGDDGNSSDVTVSADMPSESSNTSSSTEGIAEGSGHVDEDGLVAQLEIMEDNERDILASILPSPQHTVRKKRVCTPHPGRRTGNAIVLPALQLPLGPMPLSTRHSMSPRSPYYTGIQPLPRNVMEIISPPSESDFPSPHTINTGDEHSRSPIDSANRIEVVPASPELQPRSSLLPEASGPPRKFIGPRRKDSAQTQRRTSQADTEAAVVDSDQRNPPHEPSGQATDLQDGSSLRQRCPTKDPEDPPHQ